MSGARTSMRRAAIMTNAKSSLKRENVPEESGEKRKEEKPKTKLDKRPKINPIKGKDYDEHEELGHEYEELRERNIRERKELFNQMGFDSLKQGLKKQREKRVWKKREVLPPRKSSRIQEIDTGTNLLPTGNPRSPLPDLSLRDLLSVTEKGVQLQDKQDFLTTVSQSLDKIDSGASFSGDVADQLRALKLPPGNVTNVVPSQITSMAVHPTTAKLLIAAGNSGPGTGPGQNGHTGGHVGLWDVNNKEALNNGVQLFKIHRRRVNCMTFNPFQCEELWTTSNDGTVKCFDLNKQIVRFLYVNPQTTVFRAPAYHSQMDASTFLLTMHSA